MSPEHEPTKLSPAELRARLVGNAPEHDQETIRYWQQASEQERGHALYEVLALAGQIMASTRHARQEPNMLILKKGRIVIQPRE